MWCSVLSELQEMDYAIRTRRNTKVYFKIKKKDKNLPHIRNKVKKLLN